MKVENTAKATPLRISNVRRKNKIVGYSFFKKRSRRNWGRNVLRPSVLTVKKLQPTLRILKFSAPCRLVFKHVFLFQPNAHSMLNNIQFPFDVLVVVYIFACLASINFKSMVPCIVIQC